MFDIDFTFLFTAVNLAILYFVMKKFLFGRLGSFMEARSKEIADAVENGEATKNEGERFKQEQQELLGAAYDEKKVILEEAKQQAAKEYDNVIRKAKEDADRIIKDAQEQSERERERLKKELRRDVAVLAVAAASKVIKSNMDTEKNREIVDEFLKNEGAA